MIAWDLPPHSTSHDSSFTPLEEDIESSHLCDTNVHKIHPPTHPPSGEGPRDESQVASHHSSNGVNDASIEDDVWVNLWDDDVMGGRGKRWRSQPGPG